MTPKPCFRAVLAALALLCLPLHMPLAAPTSAAPMSTDTDPHLWLEDVMGERALAWVRERNAATEAALMARPGFAFAPNSCASSYGNPRRRRKPIAPLSCLPSGSPSALA